MTLHIFKRYAQSALLAATMALPMACSDSGLDELYEASKTKMIVPKTVTFGGNETTASFEIQALGSWEITGIADWFTLSSTAGSGNAVIELTTVDAENPSPTGNRTAVLTIVSGDRVGEVEVIQSKAAPFLQLTDVQTDSIGVTNEGARWTFHIRTNTQWRIPDNGKDWISCTPSSGSGNAEVTVAVSANRSEAPRWEAISVASTQPEGYSAGFKVYQQGIQTSLSVSHPYLQATATAGTGTITIDGGDAAWRLLTDQPWLHIASKAEGKGTGVISLRWDDTNSNQPRTANLIIKRRYTDEVLETCVITQAAGATPIVSRPVVTPHKTYAVVQGKATAELVPTECGIEYYLQGEPAKLQRLVAKEVAPDGSFTIEITGLQAMTTYCVRAYAINAVGGTYSEEINFTTTGSRPGEGDNPTPEL